VNERFISIASTGIVTALTLIACVRRKRPGSLTDLPNTTDRLLPLLTSRDKAFIEESMKIARTAYEDEDKRTATIEGKVTTLVSALGVTASLMLGVSTLLINNVNNLGRLEGWALILLLTPYAVAIGWFMYALQLAVQAVAVVFAARPDPRDIVELQRAGTTELRRHHVCNLLVSCRRNHDANNRKASYLKDGQEWFVRAAFALLVGAFGVILYIGWVHAISR
jgi:hypothetical protein